MFARVSKRSGPVVNVLLSLLCPGPVKAALLRAHASHWHTAGAEQSLNFSRNARFGERLISAQSLAVGVDDVVLVEFHDYSELDGNQRFGRLVEQYQLGFGDASGMAKLRYPGFIMDEWKRRNPQGRFLKSDGQGWAVISEAETLEWISWWLLYPWQPTAIPPKVKDRAQSFVTALMTAEYEPIAGSPDIRILRNLPTLQGDSEKVDVVVRDIVQKFWQACIDKVTTPDQNFRVAAIGTKGIGKTCTTPILMRLLLEKGQTVVYLMKTADDCGWYYEFCRSIDGMYVANIHPESKREEDITSLRLESTFYIVDPGDTQSVDCNPTASVRARVIIVTSPDWGHWGESAFPRDRLGAMGVFLCYPLWSLAELLAARQVIDPTCEDTDVVRRYQLFGGVPANVFVPGDMFVHKEKYILKRHVAALSSLSLDQLRRMSAKKIIELECFNPKNPLSMVTAYDVRRDDKGQCMDDFEDFVVVPVSETVEEEVNAELLLSLWTTPRENERDIFHQVVKPFGKESTRAER
jgi:hypothetical protein